MIFQDLAEINKKEKDKTTLQNHSRELFDQFWTVQGVEYLVL